MVLQFKKVFLRARVKRREFAIITNNCWGAHIFQALDLPYNSPFVGLFLTPTCYLRLLARFRYYLSQPLKFATRSSDDYINQLMKVLNKSWPIGVLGGDVEIQFLHYATEREAMEKWQRRLSRMPSGEDQLFFKFCDHDGCTQRQAQVFDALPLPHKVFFTANEMPGIKCAVFIPSKMSRVPDGLDLASISPQLFDTADWLNGGTGLPKWWSKLNCI
jgi:uncharacterized protein (DUF1919 family)